MDRAGRGAERRARDECRAPLVVGEREPLELDGLLDHDGWSEVAVTGMAIAAVADHVSVARSSISGVRFNGARLDRLELTDVVVDGCDFAGAIFEEAIFVRVAFVNCRLEGVDLGGARLTDVRFTDCQLTDLSFRMVRSERLHVEGGTAAGIDLYRAELNGSRWHDVDLTGANLSGARMERARLHGSTLTDVRGGQALTGSAIDPEQAFAVGLALIADHHIHITEDR